MSGMKLCFVGPAASINLQRWTEWFADRGHDCTIVTVEPAAPDRIMKFQQTNVTIDCWPRKLGRAVSALSMIRHIRRMKPDVVHVHYLRGLAWGLLADLPHPCVVTPWGSDILTDQGAYREWYSKAFTCRLLSRADLVTTHSSYMEAQVRALVPDVRSVVRVGWGVDLQRFRPNLDTSALHRRWNIRADQPVIFSPRLVQPLYNHDRVLQALPAVCRAIPDAVAVFTEYCADLAYKRRLQRLAADLDVIKSIRFIGEVPHAEMPCWFNMARVVVMIPASDGLPNSLLEAMACGATPVLNGLPQYDELVHDRINGRRVARDAPELAEALIHVLQDEPFRTTCRIENRRLMELNADQGCEMSKMEDIYSDLVKGRQPVPERQEPSCAR